MSFIPPTWQQMCISLDNKICSSIEIYLNFLANDFTGTSEQFDPQTKKLIVKSVDTNCQNAQGKQLVMDQTTFLKMKSKKEACPFEPEKQVNVSGPNYIEKSRQYDVAQEQYIKSKYGNEVSLEKILESRKRVSPADSEAYKIDRAKLSEPIYQKDGIYILGEEKVSAGGLLSKITKIKKKFSSQEELIAAMRQKICDYVTNVDKYSPTSKTEKEILDNAIQLLGLKEYIKENMSAAEKCTAVNQFFDKLLADSSILEKMDQTSKGKMVFTALKYILLGGIV